MPRFGTTLPEALFHAAEGDGDALMFHLEEGAVRLSFAELASRAQLAASELAARGIEPGDRVGVLGPNRPEWAVWAWAIWVAGATLVPIQLPLRVRDPDAFAESVASLVTAGGCRLVMSDPRLLGAVPNGVGIAWDTPLRRRGVDPAPPEPDDAAVIQFTSGSTAAAKGALVSHRAVMAQMAQLEWFFEKDLGEHLLFGWVPFFHDLGLFFFLAIPAVFGGSAHYLPTERFAADPAEWLRLLTSTRATWTVFPPSAVGAALRAAARSQDQIDLGALEGAGFGGEAVDPALADRLMGSARQLGLRESAIYVSYGLAEAVLCVSTTMPDQGLNFDSVDVSAMAESGVALPACGRATRRIASCGPTAPDTELRIVGPDGDLGERQIGELYLRGPSMMQGYVGHDAPDPFVDGWLRTGDLGYMAEGDVYITGRAKDMVLAMGHNYYPEDFEWAAGRVADVRAGRCAAFRDAGGDHVVLLVEPAAGAELDELPLRVRRAVTDSVGIPPGDVVVVPPGTVEKTTSGKLRRSAMRDAYLGGQVVALGRANGGPS